jgi:hypothetical protein
MSHDGRVASAVRPPDPSCAPLSQIFPNEAPRTREMRQGSWRDVGSARSAGFVVTKRRSGKTTWLAAKHASQHVAEENSLLKNPLAGDANRRSGPELSCAASPHWPSRMTALVLW